MTILVTGANGQLGNAMRVVSAASSNHFIFTDVEELDITNAEAVRQMVVDNNVGSIVNCAAYTNVDKAEENEPFAEKLNADAVANLSAAAKANDAVLFTSRPTTFLVYAQTNTPITEDEPMNPTGLRTHKATRRGGYRSFGLSCNRNPYRVALLRVWQQFR